MESLYSTVECAVGHRFCCVHVFCMFVLFLGVALPDLNRKLQSLGVQAILR